MSPGKERQGETIYGQELKSPLVLKTAAKIIMVCSGYKDNSGVVMAVTHVLIVIMLK
jgi:hypothetical protein